MARNKNNGSVFRPFSVGGVILTCFGILALAMCYLCIVYTDYRPKKIVLLGLCVYGGIVLLVTTVNVIVAAVCRKGVHMSASSVTQAVSANFMQKLTKPVIICDEKGKNGHCDSADDTESFNFGKEHVADIVNKH
jgi:hypothetical protein